MAPPHKFWCSCSQPRNSGKNNQIVVSIPTGNPVNKFSLYQQPHEEWEWKFCEIRWYGLQCPNDGVRRWFDMSTETCETCPEGYFCPNERLQWLMSKSECGNAAVFCTGVRIPTHWPCLASKSYTPKLKKNVAIMCSMHSRNSTSAAIQSKTNSFDAHPSGHHAAIAPTLTASCTFMGCLLSAGYSGQRPHRLVLHTHQRAGYRADRRGRLPRRYTVRRRCQDGLH